MAAQSIRFAGRFDRQRCLIRMIIFLVACLRKMIGCGGGAWWSGMTARDSLALALLMNTRALMGLVAINAGREAGVIPDDVFSMLVIMAVATTVMTVRLLHRTGVTGRR